MKFKHATEDPHGQEASNRRFGFLMLLNFGGTDAAIASAARNLTPSDWEVLGAQDGKDIARQLKNPRKAEAVIRDVRGRKA